MKPSYSRYSAPNSLAAIALVLAACGPTDAVGPLDGAPEQQADEPTGPSGGATNTDAPPSVTLPGAAIAGPDDNAQGPVAEPSELNGPTAGSGASASGAAPATGEAGTASVNTINAASAGTAAPEAIGNSANVDGTHASADSPASNLGTAEPEPGVAGSAEAIGTAGSGGATADSEMETAAPAPAGQDVGETNPGTSESNNSVQPPDPETTSPDTEEPITAELLAFPGAQGFGRFATGGRGGDVYHVTNLSDSGPGSLRDAISAPNRTVVFDVSGVIKIDTRLVFLKNQTIAGQTAPGGGIVVYGNGTSFTNADNAVVRYLRLRMGKVGDSGKDTISIARGHDMIFDHCSLSWSRDGTFDLNQESGYELGNITLQDSIVSQGLQTHSTGGLMNAAGVSVLRSLYIDNNSRNPKARQTTQWVNNVVYNWVASGYILGDTSGRSDGYIVGNYFISGPEKGSGTLDSPTSSYHVFAAGNYYDNDRDGTLGGRLLAQADFGSATWEQTPSVEFPPVTEMSAHEAFDYVVEHAGASLWRDEVDDYVIDELLSLGTRGATISDETSLGLTDVVGRIPTAATPLDTDQDGMPDDWEQSQGLAVTDPADRNGDLDGDGYTNLEEYLDSLVP